MLFTLLMVFTGKATLADDTVVNVTSSQTILDPATSIIDSSTVTIQSIQSKIDSATSTLQNTANSDSTAIIVIIQANVPNTDTSTATSIATTQEPIATAVVDAGNKIQIAQQTIESATVASQIAQTSLASVDSQTSLAYVAQSNVDSATVTVQNNTVVLNTSQNTLSSAPLTTIDVTSPGLIATVYSAANGSSPALPIANSQPIETIIVPQISYNWGSGQVLNSGLSDHVIVKFEGKITLPSK